MTNYSMSGCANTATGIAALQFNTTGAANTATGAGALRENVTGTYDTAVGSLALYSTTTGSNNVAVGAGAMFSNTTGAYNVAVGSYTLSRNTTGNNNTASGTYALLLNSTGRANTATGRNALYSNATGSFNDASGYYALLHNTTGTDNVAGGPYALRANTTGSANTASGNSALEFNTTGNGNTAIGSVAGIGLTTGSYNTYVGYNVSGTAAENYVTRIGVNIHDPNVAGTPTTYVAGIYNTPLSGNTVVVTSTGQLGVAAVSSERFKTDIAAMGVNTEKLEQLRPVTFKLKTDTSGTVQYGLIAEEVARVYPELVIRDQNGRIDGVRYDELAPMLLNEMQKEHEHSLMQDATIAAQAKVIEDLKTQMSELNDLTQELRAAQRH
jgi:hypothetical protein